MYVCMYNRKVIYIKKKKEGKDKGASGFFHDGYSMKYSLCPKLFVYSFVQLRNVEHKPLMVNAVYGPADIHYFLSIFLPLPPVKI